MTQRMIPADVITCVIAFHASPGDRLLVVNGVCVGVERRSATTVVHEHTPVKVIGPPKPKKSHKPKTGPPIKNRPRMLTPTVEVVLKHVSHEPRTAMQISDALHIPRKETLVRVATANRLRTLIRQGKVVATPDTKGANQLTTYKLVDKEHSNASA